MSDLFFNKNRFVDNKPATLAKPLPNDPTKLGRRTVEEIRQDMHPSNMPKKVNKPINQRNTQMKQFSQLESLKSFKEWNK